MKNKKQIVIATSLLILVTLILVGFTYAYYKTRINGNTKDKSISVVSKKLEITYADGNGVIEPTEKIEPGYTAEKTFSVENTGDESVSYSVKLDNIENTFSRTEDWTYVLKKGDTEISSGTIASGSYQILVPSTSIDSKTTDSYSLTIAYANLTDVDQSIDMGKVLNLRVNIDEVKVTWNSAPEGTLLHAIKNDNTVTAPLTVPGAEPSGRTITANFDGTESSTNLTTSNQSTLYYTYADSYELNQSTGTVTLINPVVGKYSDIYSNLVGKYVVSYSGSSSSTIANSTNISNIYKITNTSTETTDTLKYVAIKKAVTGTEAILSSTEDDYGTSYYYRGVVNNNFVNFSGMCWRVVRIQGDGSIKITLADKDHECNSSDYSTFLTNSAFLSTDTFTYKETVSNTTDDLKYETSDIKIVLEAWLNGREYTAGSKTGTFEKKIDDTKLVETEWCNDMSVSRKIYYDEVYNEIEDASKAVYTNYNYGAYGRLVTTKTATLKCNMIGLDNTKALKVKLKIGTLTADEIAFAGGSNEGSNWTYYLKDNANTIYWTMSPTRWDRVGNARVWFVVAYGRLGGVSVSSSRSVRPAVVLKSNVEITSGDGTQKNPYIIN